MRKRYLFAGALGLVGGAVATKLLMRPQDVSWADSTDLIYHPEYSWFTRIDDMRIHYQDTGHETAPVLILIHGFISSTLVWSPVFLPLADAGFRVIAIDLPGYGYSDKPVTGQYTIDAQAHVVVGLMDRLGIETATVIGASYGGAIAATIALDYPERLDRLVLVGAVSSDEPKKKLLLRILQIPVLGDIATPLYLGSRWTLRKRMADMYRRTGKRMDEWMLAARHHLLATANVQRAMIRTVRNWSAGRVQRQAPLINAPTLLVWGEEDTHIPISEGFRLRNAIPDSRLIVFKNCGHLPPTEYPEKFVEVVADFCTTKRDRTPERPTTGIQTKQRAKSQPVDIQPKMLEGNWESD